MSYYYYYYDGYSYSYSCVKKDFQFVGTLNGSECSDDNLNYKYTIIYYTINYSI